jgi:hypothetical protein
VPLITRADVFGPTIIDNTSMKRSTLIQRQAVAKTQSIMWRGGRYATDLKAG